jgi:hypothetical protein
MRTLTPSTFANPAAATSSRPGRDGRKVLLAIAPLAAALGGLGGYAAGGFIAGGVVAGLLWLLPAALVARAVNRRIDRLPSRANLWTLVGALAATLLIGGAVSQKMMFSTPDSYLAMIQSGAGDGATGFFIIVNTLLEWIVVPMIVLCSWRLAGRRNLAITAAVIFYAERATTYLYFAPTVLGWTKGPAGQTTPALLDQATLWTHLDLTRVLVDAVTVILLLIAVLRPTRTTRD